MDDHQLAEAAERLSRTLTSEALDETLRRIITGAVECLPGVHHASITIRHADGRLESVAATDAVAAQLDAAQFALRQGPSLEAAGDADQVLSGDLSREARFAAYAPAAEALGVNAQAALRLFAIDGASGALNLYSRDRGAFTTATELTRLFARQSVAALEHARELEAVQAAARDADLVGRAVGIAMERYGFADHAAFALLTRLAGHHGVGISEVAEAVIAASDQRAD